jgi:hypothetical protein
MAARLSPKQVGARRRFAAALLVAAVTMIHLAVAWIVDVSLIGLGDAQRMPVRLQAAFVRELQQTAPPSVAPKPAAPAKAKRRAPKPAPAASSPAVEPESAKAAPPEPEPQPIAEPVPEPIAEAPPTVAKAPPPAAEPVPTDSAASAPQTANAAAAASSSPSAPAFEWPASTRLSYILVGNYRGEVRGNAQVEWVRSGERYQVHLDVTIGPKFAPLLTRRMSSDGVLGEHGLSPRRYDELTQRAFGEPRVVTMHFERDAILLGNGQRRDTLPGVQDTASQFVQLIWLFTTQPERLRPGNTIEVPLALPRNVDRWVYDVLEEETLYAPFGAVNAVHLKPRRVSRPGADLTVETWFAPTLQYLPVRIRIHQDADTFVELMIERPPLQAAEEIKTPK